MSMHYERYHRGLLTARQLLVVLLLLVVGSVHAQTEKYIQSLTGLIKAGDSCVVTDDKFTDAEKWASVQQHASVDNLIAFELRYDTSAHLLSKKFSCQLTVDINCEKADHSRVRLTNIQLEVNFARIMVTASIYE